MQDVIKRFPPYGAILHQVLATNLKLQYAVHIYVGKNAWSEASNSIQTFQLALCLPTGANPSHFDWPVEGLNLIIDDTGNSEKSTLIGLADCCISNGAKVVWIYSTHYPAGLYFTS